MYLAGRVGVLWTTLGLIFAFASSSLALPLKTAIQAAKSVPSGVLSSLVHFPADHSLMKYKYVCGLLLQLSN